MRFAQWFTQLVGSIWMLLAAAVFAQGTGVVPVVPDRWTPPRLVVAQPAEEPVRLESVRVRTEVVGALAQTDVEMVFRNPNARVLEGELQFPLLDGQSVTGFALDVNGRLREAVPIDKARGQAVFEEIVRGQVDPGLLEATQGNNFKLRVYPIPAQGTRQVVIRISEALVEREQRLRYRLPLEYAERLERFHLDVRVRGAQAAPVVAPGALGAFAFASQGAYFTAQVTRSQFAGRGFLELDIARLSSALVQTQPLDGRRWFHAEIPLVVRAGSRKPPRRVAIVWDSSGSGAARNQERELALLDAYFRRMGTGDVRLLRVRDVAEPVQTFRVTGGDWRELRSALASTAWDGATNLGAVTPQEGVDEYLVFTDGLGNFGAGAFPVLPVPVFTISSAIRADHVWLRHVAHRSGGRYVDLTADDTAAAMRKLAAATTRITGVAAQGAGQLVLGSPHPEHGRVIVAGELLRPEARLVLTVEHPGAQRATVAVPLAAAGADGPLAAQHWARLRLAELEADRELHREEIRRIGRAFGIVTRETSLIVLERVEDYARHDIRPPDELLAGWERLRAQMARGREESRSRHLAEVFRRFEQKIEWWNREFPKDERPAPQPVARPGGSVAGAVMREDAMRRSSEPEARQLAERLAAAPAERAARPPVAPASAPPAAPAPLARDRAKSADDRAEASSQATIRLAPWQSDSPAARRLRAADAKGVYAVYLDERVRHAGSVAFYLDAADVLFEKGHPGLATRVLGNLAEMDLENRHVLRVLGRRLLQAGQAAAAIPVLRRVLALSPEEPQSYRDLGLALAAAGHPQEAIDSLLEVVVRPWHGRFPGVELIALAELNAIVATAGRPLDTSRVPGKLLRNLPLDLRVILDWDADDTDIDLWVTDPNGEKAYYGHRLTYQGGRMSEDFTGGYGPEEFSLRRAKPGKYRVEAQYYGDRRQRVTGPTTLQLVLTTQFGAAGQTQRMVTLRLAGRSETVFVGEFEVEAK